MDSTAANILTESSSSSQDFYNVNDVIELEDTKGSIIPFFLQSDTKFSSLKSTRLLNRLLCCFVIGGECRLVLEQLQAIFLLKIPKAEIEETMQKLHITTMHAVAEQILILKKANALPITASQCELITKSNAERLLSVYLPVKQINANFSQRLDGINVKFFY